VGRVATELHQSHWKLVSGHVECHRKGCQGAIGVLSIGMSAMKKPMPETQKKSRLTAALVTIRGSQEWTGSLRLLAAASGLSISQLIRDALRTHVSAGITSGVFDELLGAEFLSEDLRSSLLRQSRGTDKTKALARVTEPGLSPSGNDIGMISGLAPELQQQEVVHVG
jgi:hypothetical protein